MALMEEKSAGSPVYSPWQRSSILVNTNSSRTIAENQIRTISEGETADSNL